MGIDIQVIGWAIFAGIFAGGVVIIVTYLIEKFGGLIGGVLGVTPTTIVPASISLAITTLPENREAIIHSMYSFPAGMLLCAIFLLTWNMSAAFYMENFKGITLRVLLTLVVASTLSIWFVGALFEFFLFQYIAASSVSFRWIGITAIILQLIMGLANALLNTLPAPKGKNKVSPLAYSSRGIFVSLIIFSSVLISSLSAIAAGILSAFPAIFLTTMLFLWISQGKDVQAGAVGPMMLGSLSVSAYSMLFAEFVLESFDRFYSPLFDGDIDDDDWVDFDWDSVFCVALAAALAYFSSIVLFTLPVFLFFQFRNYFARISAERALSSSPSSSSHPRGDL